MKVAQGRFPGNIISHQNFFFNMICICSCLQGSTRCAVEFISSNRSDAADGHPGVTCSLPSSCCRGKFKKICSGRCNVQGVALCLTMFCSLQINALNLFLTYFSSSSYYYYGSTTLYAEFRPSQPVPSILHMLVTVLIWNLLRTYLVHTLLGFTIIVFVI